MKITIHSLDELYELSEVIAYGIGARDASRLGSAAPVEVLRRFVGEDVPTTDADIAGFDQDDESAPVVSTPVETTPVAANEASDDETQTNAAAPELDADGRRHDERIDSSSKALTAKGVWRARRNHGLSDEEVEAIKREGTVAPPEPEPEQEAPAVTETHPLPVDEPEVKPEADDPHADEDAALQATFFELVEQARKPAEDIQKDDIATTLQAAQAFTKAHSPHAFRLLRETITDKTLPGMTPGERRVLLAAMELYKSGGEA